MFLSSEFSYLLAKRCSLLARVRRSVFAIARPPDKYFFRFFFSFLLDIASQLRGEHVRNLGLIMERAGRTRVGDSSGAPCTDRQQQQSADLIGSGAEREGRGGVFGVELYPADIARAGLHFAILKSSAPQSLMLYMSCTAEHRDGSERVAKQRVIPHCSPCSRSDHRCDHRFRRDREHAQEPSPHARRFLLVPPP